MRTNHQDSWVMLLIAGSFDVSTLKDHAKACSRGFVMAASWQQWRHETTNSFTTAVLILSLTMHTMILTSEIDSSRRDPTVHSNYRLWARLGCTNRPGCLRRLSRGVNLHQSADLEAGNSCLHNMRRLQTTKFWAVTAYLSPPLRAENFCSVNQNSYPHANTSNLCH